MPASPQSIPEGAGLIRMIVGELSGVLGWRCALGVPGGTSEPLVSTSKGLANAGLALAA